jgi:hypothetical protein
MCQFLLNIGIQLHLMENLCYPGLAEPLQPSLILEVCRSTLISWHRKRPCIRLGRALMLLND